MSRETRKVITLGERMKALRKERGLSQQALAREARLDLGVVTKLEQGITQDSPHFKSVARLAQAFGISIDSFVEGTNLAPDADED